jgi:hypothetical protein
MMYRRQVLFTLADTAKEMLGGTLGPIEGARRIARLRERVCDEDPVFDPFRGIDSETDDLVVGDNRSLWAQSYLDDVSRRYAAYEATLRPDIMPACQALLAHLDALLRVCVACGFSPLMEMPYDAAGEPSYEVCPCCEFQPGVTDESNDDIAEWRRRWIAQGMPFRHPPTPLEWNAAEQLSNAAIE